MDILNFSTISSNLVENEMQHEDEKRREEKIERELTFSPISILIQSSNLARIVFSPTNLNFLGQEFDILVCNL